MCATGACAIFGASMNWRLVKIIVITTKEFLVVSVDFECRHTTPKFIPSRFCCYMKCFDKSVFTNEPVFYTIQKEGEDVAQIVVERFEKNLLWECLQKTDGNDDEGKAVTQCWLCDNVLGEDKDRDHCHFTGNTWHGT